MMKKVILVALAIVIALVFSAPEMAEATTPNNGNQAASLIDSSSTVVVAAKKKRKKKRRKKRKERKKKKRKKKKRKKRARKKKSRRNIRALADALRLAKEGEYEEASIKLFNMTRNPRYASERMRIKYILGLMLFEMKMYQVSAFQFVDVVRNSDPKYLKRSLRKLSIAADILNDDTLLNYAVSKITVEDFPKANRDMLRFRIGEYYMRKEAWVDAIKSFRKIPQGSEYYFKAKYLEGLANTRRNNLSKALKSFSRLVAAREGEEPTDTYRVAALMGMARVYYQAKKWDQSIDIYRQIPRDTPLWHDSLFESSWANMRSARFRSVLSNLHSLHSAYYQDHYLPESILLRGIVYLYICKYDEMEKTLGLFSRIYQPVLKRLESFTGTVNDPLSYFKEVEKVKQGYDEMRKSRKARKKLRVPFLVSRDIIREGDFKHVYGYIERLRAERAMVGELSNEWRRSPLGIYSKQLLKGRLSTTQKEAGKIVRGHMMAMRKELVDMFEQHNFAKFEMIQGKKETLKKKISGKGLVSKQIDAGRDRDFYIQNGYEYWPFRGEYWLDEIGDYHYLGTHGCL